MLFVFCKNDVPVIFMTCISLVEAFPAAAGVFGFVFVVVKMTFLEFYDMY